MDGYNIYKKSKNIPKRYKDTTKIIQKVAFDNICKQDILPTCLHYKNFRSAAGIINGSAFIKVGEWTYKDWYKYLGHKKFKEAVK